MDNSILNVSVIIPTYNRKNLLKRALHSASSQTLVPQEIIVVDDGSSDGTKDWVLERFPCVRYISQDNSGVSSARNRGIREAKGSWIAFLDSDDEWMPDKLEKQEIAINDSKEAWLCHTNEIWIRNGIRVNQMKKHQKYGGHSDQLSRVDNGIEKYRIKSLEKILRSESLSADQSKSAKLHLLKKLKVFSNGLEKRNKLKELSIYKKKIELWSK